MTTFALKLLGNNLVETMQKLEESAEIKSNDEVNRQTNALASAELRQAEINVASIGKASS